MPSRAATPRTPTKNSLTIARKTAILGRAAQRVAVLRVVLTSPSATLLFPMPLRAAPSQAHQPSACSGSAWTAFSPWSRASRRPRAARLRTLEVPWLSNGRKRAKLWRRCRKSRTKKSSYLQFVLRLWSLWIPRRSTSAGSERLAQIAGSTQSRRRDRSRASPRHGKRTC